MVRHTLKILQHLLQDFYNVSDHFTTLRSKCLIYMVYVGVTFRRVIHQIVLLQLYI